MPRLDGRIIAGDVLVPTDANKGLWFSHKEGYVVEKRIDGSLFIRDDDGDIWDESELDDENFVAPPALRVEILENIAVSGDIQRVTVHVDEQGMRRIYELATRYENSKYAGRLAQLYEQQREIEQEIAEILAEKEGGTE